MDSERGNRDAADCGRRGIAPCWGPEGKRGSASAGKIGAEDGL
jgi:hypothetical protein